MVVFRFVFARSVYIESHIKTDPRGVDWTWRFRNPCIIPPCFAFFCIIRERERKHRECVTDGVLGYEYQRQRICRNR